MRSYLCLISAATCALLVATEGAFASTPVPGPIAAVGGPALLVIGGVFLAVRYFRSRSK